jgi:hypothetical protein
MKERYTDVDLARAEALWKSDAELRARVLDEIRMPRRSTEDYVRAVSDLYLDFLGSRIQAFDTRGAHVDLSTLALVAGRNLEALFVDVALALEADQIHKIRRRRRRRLRFAWLAARIDRWRLGKDQAAVSSRVHFELNAHVMFGDIALEQIRATKEYALNLNETFGEIADSLRERIGRFEEPGLAGLPGSEDREGHELDEAEEEDAEEEALEDFRRDLDRWRDG